MGCWQIQNRFWYFQEVLVFSFLSKANGYFKYIEISHTVLGIPFSLHLQFNLALIPKNNCEIPGSSEICPIHFLKPCELDFCIMFSFTCLIHCLIPSLFLTKSLSFSQTSMFVKSFSYWVSFISTIFFSVFFFPELFW